MQKEIKQALELLPDYSRIHYLQYLDLIRMGESHESEQSLRRFFDNNTIKDNHTIYQYALLHLAAMRAQLGMAGAAREALVEATHVARDCQDHLCLLYILCWESRLLLQGALKNEAGGSDNRGGDGDGEADAIRAHRSISMLIDKARAMENHEMRAVGHIMLVDLLLLLSNDADFSEIFSNLVRVRALIVEHDLTKLHASWYLTASRVFMHNESGAWLSLLHAQLAGAAGQTSLTERENSEFMRQLARTQAVLCGPLHAAQYMVGQLSQAKFINPTRMDALADQLRWLQVDDNTKDYHSHEGACDGSDSGSGDGGARRLSEARSLAEDGYICEARELLIEIACCGEARIPSDLRYRRSLYEPIAVRKAIQLLSSLE
ncbi:hypothetical protein LPJ66_009809 [Kickxella alabastrina]|uniref:Uncharacterized protein n=1 Tax=Kickxella alabastrina TaxID=61397 RepID=A0ACC1I607_9FUNG|nr:hypothetical protein LPJ66_009809 [Kickxella alabastrina]